MKNLIKVTIMTLFAIFLLGSGISAQNHPDKAKSHQHIMKENKGMMNHEKKMGSGKNMSSNIVHTGVIDVKAIDKNKDGKVYQDMMDWNVISDKPGKCPNCGMKLKEVSINKAKQNLKKHGYKLK